MLRTWRPALDDSINGNHAALLGARSGIQQIAGVAAPAEAVTGQPVWVAQHHVHQEQPTCMQCCGSGFLNAPFDDHDRVYVLHYVLLHAGLILLDRCIGRTRPLLEALLACTMTSGRASQGIGRRITHYENWHYCKTAAQRTEGDYMIFVTAGLTGQQQIREQV